MKRQAKQNKLNSKLKGGRYNSTQPQQLAPQKLS